MPNTFNLVTWTIKGVVFLFLLLVVGFSIYAIVYYNTSDVNNKDAKIYTGLFVIPIVFVLFIIIYSLI